MHRQPQQRQLQTVGHFTAPNKLPGASHRQHLILIGTGFPSQVAPKSTHLEVQTTSVYDPFNFISSTHRGRSQQKPDSVGENSALSVPTQQLKHCTQGQCSWTLEGQLDHGKSQQQSRLNYNSTAHKNHTRDIPGAPSSRDQVDCSTENHKTPTTKGHHTETNTERQPKWGNKETCPK